MELSIVTLVCDELELLSANINLFRRLNIEFIIGVDNNSKKDISHLLRNEKTFHFDLNDNLALHYNKGISLCTNKWILILDADEIIFEKDLMTLEKKLKENAYTNTDCYNMSRNNWKDGSFNKAISPTDSVRRLIANNNKINLYGRKDCEVVNAKYIKFLNNVSIQHFPTLYKSNELKIERHQIFKEISAKEIADGSINIKNSLKIKNNII